ncbi:MAG: hypothetical protein M3Z09_13885 [Acidobacteriota bacterium]|nr:hypothetical protein [Acidobacteriota bacterium]
MRALIWLLCAPFLLRGGTGGDLLQELAAAPLDPAECYRVREVHLTRDEAQFYFTDGFLIFGKPVGSNPVTAVFSADVEGGDAELLLLPPTHSERRALSTHVGAPNLEEHFGQAALVFSGGAYRELMTEIKANPYNKKSAEMGALLADRWSLLAKSLGRNFGLRLATDILSPGWNRKGFLAVALSGAKLGTFNVIFDPRAPEQLLLGAASDDTRDTKDTNFDVWTSFTSRSYRRQEFAPEFVLSDFRIDSRLDPDLTLHCTTKLRLKARGGEAALPFEISNNMRVLSAQVNGEPAEVLLSEHARLGLPGNGANDAFVLIPRVPVSAGQTAEIEIAHEGKVIADAGNHVFSVGSRGSWYPNHGRQFATFDLSFRAPKDLDLVATGEVVEDRIDGLMRLSRTVTKVPIRLAGFNLGVYDRARSKHGDLTIEVCANHSVETTLQPRVADLSWSPQPTGALRPGRRNPGIQQVEPTQFPPQSPQMRLKALADEIGEVMEFYTSRFGPLTLKHLEVTPVPGRFGQGFPGLIYLSTLSYLRPGERVMNALDEKQKVFFSDLLHAHEAAHQWWGNIVTSAGYHDEWLMEALANYSALLFMEQRKGPRAVDLVLEDYRLKLLAKAPDGQTVESAGPVVQGTRLDQAWIPIVYGKGTWIMHMLRRRLGDPAFLNMLGTLRREYEDKAINTDEFRAFCSRFLPAHSPDPKLELFFDQWVYGTGIPALKLTSAVKGSGTKWRVAGTVAQSQVPEDFAADVPIEIQLGRGRSVIRTVTAGAEPASFEFDAPSQPVKAVIDFRSILHR